MKISIILLMALFFCFASAFPLEKMRDAILPPPVTTPQPVGQTFQGAGTFFTPTIGACGGTNSANDMVVALNHAQFDPSSPGGNSNKNTLCGTQVSITFGGKSVVATIVDECPDCGFGALDMSPAVFKQLANLSVGVISVKWSFLK